MTAGLSRPEVAGRPRVTAHSIDSAPRHAGGRWWLLAITLVTLFAFVVRLLRLDFVNFHSDEASFIRIAYQGALLQATAYDDPHPPLFLAMLQAWMGVAGVSQVGIRLLPLLYTSVLPPLTFQLGRQLGNRALGLAAAFVVAANPAFIFYAKEARDNGLMAMTGALSFVLLLLALKRPKLLPAYVLAALMALYSHYYDIPIVGLELLAGAIWLFRQRKPRLWPWVAAPLALAVGFGAWLLYARSTIANYNVGHGTLQQIASNLAETFQAFNFGFSVRQQDLLWPSVAAGLLALVGIVGALAIRRGLLWVLLAYALAPLAFGAATLLHQTNFNPRYLFAGAPAYALILGSGLVLLRRWHWAAAAAGAAFLLGCTGYTIHNTDFDSGYQPNGYRQMVEYLARHAAPSDSIVLDGISQWPLYFYYGQLRAQLPQRVEFLPRDTLQDTQQTVNELLADGGVWYLETDLLRYDPHHDTERLLAADGYQAFDGHFAGQRLEYFGGPGAGPVRSASATVGPLRLTAASTPDRPVSAGQALEVELDWQRGPAPVQPFKLSLRLDGPDGTAAQNDTLPQGGYADLKGWAAGQTLRERAGLVLPVGTIPGVYTLHALVYDAASGQPFGPPLDLGSVTVDHAARQDAAAAELAPVGAAIGPLRLAAASLSSNGITPGDTVPVTLLWTGSATAQPQRVTVAVGQDRQEHIVGGERYPTTAWKANDVVRDVVQFRVRPSTPAGAERVTVDGVPVGSLHVLPVVRSFTVPPLAHQVNARFGDVAELLGYDAQPTTGGLHVQFTWRDVAEMDTSYTVFVHALDAGGKVLSQADVAPGTDRWVPGQVVTTSYELPNAPPDARLEVGLYTPASGKRLPLSSGTGDSLILPA